MGHIKECASGVPLHPHVVRASHSCQRDKSTRLGDLGLVVVMGRQIRYTSYSVALHLDIWAEHLPNKGFQPAQFDNEELVVGCTPRVTPVRGCLRAKNWMTHC